MLDSICIDVFLSFTIYVCQNWERLDSWKGSILNAVLLICHMWIERLGRYDSRDNMTA